jgi:hypothetical protein
MVIILSLLGKIKDVKCVILFFLGLIFVLFIQENTGKTFTRKLSKREKKEKKKQDKAKQRDHA